MHLHVHKDTNMYMLVSISTLCSVIRILGRKCPTWWWYESNPNVSRLDSLDGKGMCGNDEWHVTQCYKVAYFNIYIVKNCSKFLENNSYSVLCQAWKKPIQKCIRWRTVWEYDMSRIQVSKLLESWKKIEEMLNSYDSVVAKLICNAW
jgi:hypothetical protein